MSNTVLLPDSGRLYKVFLVEEDDDERERVMSGRATAGEFNLEYSHLDIQSAILTLNLVPSEDGSYFRIEDFSQESVDEEQDWE